MTGVTLAWLAIKAGLLAASATFLYCGERQYALGLAVLLVLACCLSKPA